MFAKKQNLMYLVLSVVALFSVYKIYKHYTFLPTYQKMTPIPVETDQIQQHFLARRETFPAKIEALDSVSIISEIPGRIKTLHFKEGDEVEKGALLVQLEDSHQRAQVEGIKAELKRINRAFENAQKLASNDNISKVALKDKKYDLQGIKARLAEAEANLSKTKIIAPFKGIIGIRQVSVGAHIHSNTEITKLNNIHKLRVLFSVPADRIEHTKPGNIAYVNIGSSDIPQTVTISARESNLHSSNNQVNVVATMDNTDLAYLPGQYANITLITSKEESVLALPESALIKGDNDRTSVFIVRENRAIEVPVELGLRKGNEYIEIINGLNEGDEIILDVGESRGMRIIDGTPVRKIAHENEAKENEKK